MSSKSRETGVYPAAGSDWIRDSRNVLDEVLPECTDTKWVEQLGVTAFQLVGGVEKLQQRTGTKVHRLKRLAQIAVDIAVKVITPLRGRADEDFDQYHKMILQRDVEGLQRTLADILCYVTESSNRSFLGRLFSSSGKSRIEELNKDLHRAVDQLRIKQTTEEWLGVIVPKPPPYVQGASTTFATPSSTPSTIPEPPLLFLGRDFELQTLVNFSDGTGNNLCILGAPGMGKSTLACALARHPSMIATFQSNRFWVSCDDLRTSEALLAAVAKSTGMDTDADLGAVVHRLASPEPSSCDRALLIIDNFDFIWDTADEQVKVERLLAYFTSLANVTVVVTCRGSVTPASTKWTRVPFGELGPLPKSAAVELFKDLSDRESESAEEVEDLITNLDYIPLAITLIAQVAKVSIPLSEIQSQWHSQGSKLLSCSGRNRVSNLDVSVKESLNSPRISMEKETLAILSLLSILPDGVARNDIPDFLSNFDSMDRLGAECTLKALSLVVDRDDRITVISTVRAYMKRYHPITGHDLHHLSSLYASPTYLNNTQRNAKEIRNFISVLSASLKQPGDHDSVESAVRQLTPVLTAKKLEGDKPASELLKACRI